MSIQVGGSCPIIRHPETGRPLTHSHVLVNDGAGWLFLGEGREAPWNKAGIWSRQTLAEHLAFKAGMAAR